MLLHNAAGLLTLAPHDGDVTVIDAAADRTRARHVEALLSHYGLCAEDFAAVVRLSRHSEATVDGRRLARWSVEDLVHAVTAPHSPNLAVGRLSIAGPTSQVALNGRPIPLTRTERRLLRHLARHPGAVHSRVHLVRHVWPVSYGGRSDVVDTYISYLRHKLPDPWRMIVRTTYGGGYSVHAP